MMIIVWRLAAQMFMSALILNALLLSSKHVVAELNVIPLWNKADTESCSLAIDNNLQDVVKFTGDPIKTCSVQLASSNGTAAFIQIPQGALMYAERQKNILKCQMKYVSLTADEPCVFVSRHPKLKLIVQGDSENGSIIIISQVTGNTSATICPDGTGSKEQHTSRISQTNHCQVREFENVLSCEYFPDYTCFFLFPGNCNVTLGNRVVEFQCLDNNVHSSHKALMVYPPWITALNLAHQRIVEINVNTFMTLTLLKHLYLDSNDLVVLPAGLLSGLNNLEYLTLSKNRLSSLDGNMFNKTKKIKMLFLWSNNLKKLANNLFHGLGNLNKLDLHENDLTALSRGMFMGLTNLKYLYLQRNQINSLDEALFDETNTLIELELSDNDLEVLPKGLFMGLTYLELLHLARNQIKWLDEAMFLQTNKLI